MEGCCWPLSAAPGQTIEFRTSTPAPSYTVTYVTFRTKDPATVTPLEIEQASEVLEVAVAPSFIMPGRLQVPSNFAEGCGAWSVEFTLVVPKDWVSGIYAAKCIDAAGTRWYVTFVVKPAANARSQLFALANTNTWNAYNPWGGASRYTSVGDVSDRILSFLRPNESAAPLGPHPAWGQSLVSHHLARAELWVLNWLARAGYSVDVYSDHDLHAEIDDVSAYKGLILTTHPEYWTVRMYDRLREYLAGGGCLLYLGGNGIYDVADFSPDSTSMTVHGSYDLRTRRFRAAPTSRPESHLLGVAFPVDAAGQDAGNVLSRAGYKVRTPDHWLFEGTGVNKDDLIGERGWNYWPLTAQSFDQGGAAGLESDVRDAASPSCVLLALGDNPATDARAEMVHYVHPGGGFVFSVGSIAFGGSLVIDARLQRPVRNALDACLGRIGRVRVPQAGILLWLLEGLIGVSPSGQLVKVPPRGPIRDILIGLALTELADQLDVTEQRVRLQRAALAVIEGGGQANAGSDWGMAVPTLNPPPSACSPDGGGRQGRPGAVAE